MTAHPGRRQIATAYTPGAAIDDMVAPEPQALAARAADIVASSPVSVDAVAEAAERLPGYVSETLRWDLTTAVEATADRIARHRHPLLAEMLGNGPVPWECWQRELLEPWPILADAAGHLGQSLPVRTPTGTWTLQTRDDIPET